MSDDHYLHARFKRDEERIVKEQAALRGMTVSEVLRRSPEALAAWWELEILLIQGKSLQEAILQLKKDHPKLGGL